MADKVTTFFIISKKYAKLFKEKRIAVFKYRMVDGQNRRIILWFSVGLGVYFMQDKNYGKSYAFKGGENNWDNWASAHYFLKTTWTT